MDSTTQLLSEILANQRLILRGLRHISRQNDAMLKADARPKLTIKAMWDNYGKPISSMLAWAPVAWVLQQLYRGETVQGVLAKLSGFF
jgi:hypothetical protein